MLANVNLDKDLQIVNKYGIIVVRLSRDDVETDQHDAIGKHHFQGLACPDINRNRMHQWSVYVSLISYRAFSYFP